MGARSHPYSLQESDRPRKGIVLVLSCVPSSGDGPFDAAGSSAVERRSLRGQRLGGLGNNNNTNSSSNARGKLFVPKENERNFGRDGRHENQRRGWKEKTNTTGKGQVEGWI